MSLKNIFCSFCKSKIHIRVSNYKSNKLINADIHFVPDFELININQTLRNVYKVFFLNVLLKILIIKVDIHSINAKNKTLLCISYCTYPTFQVKKLHISHFIYRKIPSKGHNYVGNWNLHIKHIVKYQDVLSNIKVSLFFIFIHFCLTKQHLYLHFFFKLLYKPCNLKSEYQSFTTLYSTTIQLI